MKYWRGFLTAAIFAAITLGLQWIAGQFPQLVDIFYPYVTREVQNILATWTGGVEITVWQVLAMLILVALLVSIVLMIVLKWNFFQWMGWVLSGASLVWLLHTGIYGLNYYASPLQEDIRMDSYDFTVSDLEDATFYFLTKANDLALQLPRDENGDLAVGTFEELAQQAGNGFRTLVYDTGAVFGGSVLPVKRLAWADMYTAMGITGIHMAITGEAAVNPQTPTASLPFTMCHEMAHRMSIATEDDANFAAFLACRANESQAFQYSAYYMAYRYCYNALATAQSTDAAAAAARINSGISDLLRRDLEYYDHFFNSNRDDQATEFADTVNDTYLKTSGDSAGVASYSQVCDLLVNWHIQQVVLPELTITIAPFDPYDETQVDLSGIVNAGGNG